MTWYTSGAKIYRIRCIAYDAYLWRDRMIHQKDFATASLIVKLGNAVTYYRNVKMEDIGLTSVQSDALIAMLRDPEITASQLKERLNLSQSTVAGIIERLESKGLISKVTDAEDARKTHLIPTEKGKQLENTLREIALDIQNALLRGMNPEEQAEFSRLLGIALDNMNEVRK